MIIIISGENGSIASRSFGVFEGKMDVSSILEVIPNVEFMFFYAT